MSDFIPWDGGEMPVPPLTHVLLQFRKPELTISEVFYSPMLDWTHGEDGPEFDIVAYKLADVQPVFQVWTGGTNPVGESIVEYILRDSPNEVYRTYANNLDWEHVATDPDYDIVLYRIIG